jgi:hypothetical protein
LALAHIEKQPKQIEFQFVPVQTEKKINCFEENLIGSVFWRFCRFVSFFFQKRSVCFGCFDTGPKQTETNQKQNFGFA